MQHRCNLKATLCSAAALLAGAASGAALADPASDAYRRANGTMAPRMFNELPICQQAYRARKQLQSN